MGFLSTVAAVVFQRLSLFTWRRASRFGPIARLLPLPVRVALEPSLPYAIDAGVILAAPAQQILRAHSAEEVRDLLESPHAVYLSDTPFVVGIQNSTEGHVRLKEIHLHVKLWWPEDRAVRGMGVVSATTSQAGGRGSEGDFVVAFRGQAPLQIPVLRSAATEAGRSDRGLTLAREQYGEIALKFAPNTPGRYTIGVVVEFNVRGVSKRKRLRDLRILHVNDFAWIDAAVTTFGWSRPKRIEQEALDHRLRRILELREQQDWSAVRQDRRVIVRGELAMGSWDP